MPLRENCHARHQEIVVSTRGDSIAPIVDLVFKYLRSIEGAVPKYGRAPRTAFERAFSALLDGMPRAALKGNCFGKAGSSSDA